MGLFNFFTGLLNGAYAGVFLAQNYEVPVVPAPQAIVDKVKQFLEENKKTKD